MENIGGVFLRCVEPWKKPVFEKLREAILEFGFSEYPHHEPPKQVTTVYYAFPFNDDIRMTSRGFEREPLTPSPATIRQKWASRSMY